MKKIFLLISFILAFVISGFAQSYNKNLSSYAYLINRGTFDSTLILPYHDTTMNSALYREGAIVFNENHELCVWNGSKWNVFKPIKDTLDLSMYWDSTEVKDYVQVYVNDQGFLKIEQDPVFITSVAYNISAQDTLNWDSAYVRAEFDSVNNYLKLYSLNGNIDSLHIKSGSDSSIIAGWGLDKNIIGKQIHLFVDSSEVVSITALNDTLHNKLIIDTTTSSGILHDIKPGYGANISGGSGTVINQDVTVTVDTTSSHALVSKDRLANAISNLGFGDMRASVYDPTGVAGDAFDYNNFYNTPTPITNNNQIANGKGYITHADAADQIGDSLANYNPEGADSSVYSTIYRSDQTYTKKSNFNELTSDTTIMIDGTPKVLGAGNIRINPNILPVPLPKDSIDIFLTNPIDDDKTSDSTLWSSQKISDALANAGAGSVTSVGLSAPTGFSVDGSPVTSAGTLQLKFASGYSLPSNAEQAAWDDKADLSDIENSTITVSAGGIATGGGNFTLNQGSNKTITVSVPATDLGITGTTGARTITSSTGDDASIPLATTAASGLLSPSDKVKLNSLPAANTNLANTELSLPSEGIRSFDINGGSLTFLDNTIGPYTPNLLFLDNKNVIMTVGDPDAIGYAGVSITNHATNGFSPTISLTTQTQDNGGVTYSLDSVKFNWINEREDGSSINVMELDTAGNVTIQGHLTAIGGGSTGSDIRLKDTLSMEPVHVIDQLHTVMFRYKPGLGLGDKLYIGYIAQEIEKYMPSVVGSTYSGIKTVDYEQVHTAAINDLIQVVKQQQKQIDALTARVENLEGKKHNPKSGHVPGLGSYRVIDTMTAFKLAHMDKEHRDKISVIQNEKGKLVFVYWNEKRD